MLKLLITAPAPLIGSVGFAVCDKFIKVKFNKTYVEQQERDE